MFWEEVKVDIGCSSEFPFSGYVLPDYYGGAVSHYNNGGYVYVPTFDIGATVYTDDSLKSELEYRLELENKIYTKIDRCMWRLLVGSIVDLQHKTLRKTSKSRHIELEDKEEYRLYLNTESWNKYKNKIAHDDVNIIHNPDLNRCGFISNCFETYGVEREINILINKRIPAIEVIRDPVAIFNEENCMYGWAEVGFVIGKDDGNFGGGTPLYELVYVLSNEEVDKLEL